ncbi:Ras-related protein Rab-6 [Tritrichomonas foetus]|uniref:Ras-related protein Rab-6 n=1 Tax=Tritrichomonas foetus TaxID=1144522 RepID=A0A1J4KJH3_9EUKA|nr:Ras-related protein Rab-6 [Tritrichomonas foetus]|eukprot:OHT11250.1 Ras-related protein Rab-6 [Tritrichomonas foetus]
MIAKKSNSLESKVIIIGEPSVGKTSILTQFNTRTFDSQSESTVGASFLSKPVETSHGPINLFMWDTAGQERYRSLIPMYSRNAAAALLVIDVTSQGSVDSLDSWLSIIKEHCPKKCKIYVIANKIDLEKQISIEKVEEWAKVHNLPFFKATATKYESVEPIFLRVAEDIGGTDSNSFSKPSTTQNIKDTQESHTNCC